MSRSAAPPRVKSYPGLRALGMLFKILALISLIITVITIAAAIVELLTNPGSGIGAASTSTTQGTIGAIVITFDSSSSTQLLLQAVPFLLWSLLTYATAQVIDVTLSINDNLRRLAQPGQEYSKELQQTAEEMTAQTKKITALLEQHHRRLNSLENKS